MNNLADDQQMFSFTSKMKWVAFGLLNGALFIYLFIMLFYKDRRGVCIACKTNKQPPDSLNRQISSPVEIIRVPVEADRGVIPLSDNVFKSDDKKGTFGPSDIDVISGVSDFV